MTPEVGIPEPETAALLEWAAKSRAPPFHAMTPDEARAAFVQRVGATNMASVPLAEVRDIEIPAADSGKLGVRLYRPDTGTPPYTVLYFHGGGFVIGSVDTHDPICRYLAAGSGCIVASLEYRLAPEHRYPAAVEDALAAFDWVSRNAAQHGGDQSRIVVAGDSAGGTLAAAVAQSAKRQARPIAKQVLIYPALDTGGQYPSRDAFQDRFLLTRETIRWFGQHYFGHDRPVLDPYASPARCADLRGLPPAYIVTAELDPLRDEAVSYASALESAGVPVTYRCARGTIHGFLGMGRFLAVARDELDCLATFLRAV